MKRDIYCSAPPKKLTIETSTACNLSCVMCSKRIETISRPPFLSEQFIDRITPLFETAQEIELHGIGEPLLSPAFWKLLDRLLPSDKSVAINSNFAISNDALIKKLAHSNLSHLNVSMDAATATTYQKIRGGRFCTVLRNIRLFMKERKTKPERRPHLMINMTLMLENIRELKKFVTLGKRLGVDAVFIGHLNKWPEDIMARFGATQGAVRFNYQEQGLWNYKSYSNQVIQEAMAHAAAIGIPLEQDFNKPVLFDDI